jgi:DNA-binding MarR family transcriptional regulator
MSLPKPIRLNRDQANLVTLTEADARDAERLIRLLSGFRDDQPSDPDPVQDDYQEAHREELIIAAQSILNGRRMRREHFHPGIFGEPGWDILLGLYITDTCGERQTVGKLAEWLTTPPTTVMRWVAVLEREQVVRRSPHPTDRRIMFIEITDKGRSSLDAYLARVPKLDFA